MISEIVTFDVVFLLAILHCSLLIQLRCQVHIEVAKCEEDQEQIAVAIKHLHKVALFSPLFMRCSCSPSGLP